MSTGSRHWRRICAVPAAGVLAAVMIIGALPAFGQEAAGEVDPNYEPEPIIYSGDYGYWENEDGTVTIAEYTGEEDVIEIPAELDGKQVAAIGQSAFGYYACTSLTIPEGVDIGYQAFEYCKIAETLALSAGVRIDERAFNYAQLPQVVTIPEGAELQDDAFSYTKNVEIVNVEADAVIGTDVFSYSKKLRAVVCAEGVQLQANAFGYCDKLREAILTGEADMDENAFYGSDALQIRTVEDADVEQIIEELLNEEEPPTTAPEPQSPEKTLGAMTFTVPEGTIESPPQPGYQLGFMFGDGNSMLGAAEFPPSILDFTKEETLETMAESAKSYVDVEDTRMATISGYPAVWIDIKDKQEPTMVGVYLYISTEEHLYHLMFVNIGNSRAEFDPVAESIVIEEN